MVEGRDSRTFPFCISETQARALFGCCLEGCCTQHPLAGVGGRAVQDRSSNQQNRKLKEQMKSVSLLIPF